LTFPQQDDSDDNMSGDKIDKPTFKYKSKRAKKMPEWLNPELFSDIPSQKSVASVTKSIPGTGEPKKSSSSKKKIVNPPKSTKKMSQKAKQANRIAKNINTRQLATKAARFKEGTKESSVPAANYKACDDTAKKKDPLALAAHRKNIADNGDDTAKKKDPLTLAAHGATFVDNGSLDHAAVALGVASGDIGKTKDKPTSMTLGMAHSGTFQMKDPLGFAALGATFCAKNQVKDPLASAAHNTASCDYAQAKDPLAIVAIGNPEVCREKKRKKRRQKINKSTTEAGKLRLDKRRTRNGNTDQDQRYNIFDERWIERPLINCFHNLASNQKYMSLFNYVDTGKLQQGSSKIELHLNKHYPFKERSEFPFRVGEFERGNIFIFPLLMNINLMTFGSFQYFTFMFIHHR